jgi:hypothetical protein
MTKLKTIPGLRPLFTNASRNRFAAIECHQAGISNAEIAAHWPRVWKLDREGKLSMKITMVYSCGTTETLIQMRGVEEFIANWKQRHG